MSGNIHVWHVENINIIPFMYDPVILSLKQFLPLMYTNRIIKFNINDVKNNDDLIEGDILIWVGFRRPNFKELKKRNIYIIFYNLEPYVDISETDEIWTYSRYLFEEYKKVSNKIIKFIPTILDKSVPTINYLENNNDIKLTFMGYIPYGREEKNKIINNSGVKINMVYNLWSHQAFNLFINNNTHIFLNITKGDTKVMPMVRVNKLLSHKCIIISEHLEELEEELYKDMVFFKDLHEIGDFFKSLINKSKAELDIIAESSYQKFSNSFSLENAFKLIQTTGEVNKNSSVIF